MGWCRTVDSDNLDITSDFIPNDGETAPPGSDGGIAANPSVVHRILGGKGHISEGVGNKEHEERVLTVSEPHVEPPAAYSLTPDKFVDRTGKIFPCL